MLYPFQFRPVFRRYLWGGRRLHTALGKELHDGNDWAECWEIVDHGPDQSVVANGPLTGMTLGGLVELHGEQLFGRHHPQRRFPLLFKFLDANQTLSVQVHPNDYFAAQLMPADFGKTEAWVVVEAEPGAKIYAGLKPGIGHKELYEAVREGRCAECLHAFEPSPGDCIYIPAGTVHALGAGLVVAEIQQSSDVTYRLFDWNRVGVDGKPRPLHVEQALEVIDFARGQVQRQVPRRIGHGIERLVDCEKFVLDRRQMDATITLGGDGRCHLLAVLEGQMRLGGEAMLLGKGAVVLLPAALGEVAATPEPTAQLLDVFLP